MVICGGFFSVLRDTIFWKKSNADTFEPNDLVTEPQEPVSILSNTEWSTTGFVLLGW